MIKQYGNIGVLGYGVTGRSVVRYLTARGVTPQVFDTRDAAALNVDASADVTFQFGVTTLAQAEIDTLVVSPGLDWDSCLIRSIPERVTVMSDIDLFFHEVTQPVIGVTGTNGKSTVTSLVGHLLQACGHSFRTGGNLGEAALDLIDSEAQAHGYVLELSSFQLERTSELRFAASTLLNVTEDHLDKHGTLAAYTEAKQRVYTNCALAVANRADKATYPQDTNVPCVTFGLDEPPTEKDWGVRDGQLCVGDTVVCSIDELPLPGAHNVANILAACALVSPWVEPAQLRAALTGFAGLPHRFELVAEHNGIRFVNDSKATNVGAAVAALEGFDTQTVVLIGGGDAKGADLSEFVDSMSGRVKALVTLGQDGAELAELANQAGIPSTFYDNFEQTVAAGFAACEPGDTLLLSPGCASIDMFPNFGVRGETFANLVRELIDQEAGGQH